jgi:hypothetical protein
MPQQFKQLVKDTRKRMAAAQDESMNAPTVE